MLYIKYSLFLDFKGEKKVLTNYTILIFLIVYFNIH